jgi:hypothetical protein
MKKLLLIAGCCLLSWVNTFAEVGEHVQFSIYHQSTDGSDQFRIKMKTDTSSYWDGTTHTMTMFQVPIRFLTTAGLSLSADNTGLSFSSGILSLLPVVTDPTDNSYSLQRLYYDGGTTYPSGGWAKGTEYDIALITIIGGTISTDIQLPEDTSHVTGIYIYAQLDSADYMANYTDPFYGNTSSLGGWEYASLSGSALPVSLVDFNATAENQNDAFLTWQTATEVNNRGFYIERSTDGNQWKEIDFVSTQAPRGNSSILQDYEYYDQDVYGGSGNGTYYYRIRQQDFNGAAEYVGKVRAVKFNSTVPALMTVYPNPARHQLNIAVKDGAPARYCIVDLNGKNALTGCYASPIDISRLPPSQYQVTVYDVTGNVLGVQKIIVAR